MNKKTLLIVCISLLLAIALFIIVKGLQNPQRLTIDSEQTTEKEQEDLHPDGEQDDSESEDQKFISALTEAIQSTISFFAHKETNIVAIGDSLTQGVGDSQKKGGYVGILERTINKEDQLAHFENYGKRGDRTDQLIDRLDSTEIQASIREADIILITIGANDIMQVVKENITNLTYEQFTEARTKYESRLQSLFNKIKALNGKAEIYLIGFYNPFAKYFPNIKELEAIADDWNRTSEQVTEQYERVTYIPTDDLFANPDDELYADDNFHPNDQGYEQIAQRVLDYLTDEER
ncbi:MAG TPA: SGNH/GDSL hydrolase family protein [Bacillota bacterium]|nr:SGNH/GDSL hydrolase family protein [Bacillota bacterium]